MILYIFRARTRQAIIKDHQNMKSRLQILFIYLLIAAALKVNAQQTDLARLAPGETLVAFGEKLKVTGIRNPDVVGREFSRRFRYEDIDNPKIRQLRTQYNLDAVIEQGESEFEQMVLLNAWVFQQFKRFGQPTKNSKNALEILQMIPEGATFFCSQFASTLMSAAYSVGWTARSVGLHNQFGNPGSPEHSTVEIWSNQYRKWVMFDPTFELFIEKNNVPLNCREIRDEWFENKGANLVYVRGAARNKFTKNDLPITYPGTGFSVNAFYPDWYSLLMFFGNADYMDTGEDYGNNCFMIVDKRNEQVKWHTRHIPHNLDDAYWSLADANMTITPAGKGRLTVRFNTNTPNFDTYMVKENNKAWKLAGVEYTWILKKGKNTLVAAARNKFGVRGPENFITVIR